MEVRPVSAERAAPPDRGYAWALLAIALALLLFRLGAKDVWEASEGRPLESAREMRAHGDWLVQYTNGAVDLTKPPLYAWCAGALFGLTGVENELVGRLPSVLAALGVLGAVYVLGRRIAGPRAGFFAGVALLTTAKFAWQARLAELETLLALGVTWAYVFFDDALEARTPRARWAAFTAYHGALGFACAVKGPIALLLVIPGAWAYAIATHRFRRLRCVAYPATAIVTLALGLAWALAVVRRDPASLDTFLSFARGDNVGHLHDPFYYLAQYPLYALPWTPLALWGLRLRWALDLPPEAARRGRLPVAAFVTTFLAQSALHAKQTHYLVPVVFPMGALLAGLVLDRWLARREPRATFGAVLRAGAPALAIAIGIDAWLRAPEAPAALAGTAAALCALAVAVAFVLRRSGRSWTAAARVEAALLLVLALEALALGWVVPALNPAQSSRAFLARVAAKVPAGEPLGWTIFASHSDYLWYLPMSLVGTGGIPELVGPSEAETSARVRAHLAGGGRRFALVTADQASGLGDVAVSVEREDAFQRKGRRVVLLRSADPR